MAIDRIVTSLRRRAAGGLLLALPLATAGCAEGPVERRAYVELLGADTTAVEVLSRSAEGYEGARLTRQPVTRVARYRASLDEEGRVSRLEVEWATPAENPQGPPPQRLEVELDGDSATMIRERGEATDSSRAEAPSGSVPAIGFPLAVATWEQAVRQLLESGEDRYEVAFLAPTGQLSPTAVERRSADTVALDFFGSPMLATISEEGEVLGISGAATTLKIEVRPADDPAAVDVEALAASFAARDAAGEGFGVASPQDTVEASSAGATLRVVYSRPATRGRRIWGGLVPYGEVWRTGANAATHFTTNRDLVLGEAEVPAGAYTLWTRFTEQGATLILNEQTGIWGTAYDEAHDFVRIPLEREELGEPVERFTIELEPAREGGRLALAWDRARFSVPLRVK